MLKVLRVRPTPKSGLLSKGLVFLTIIIILYITSTLLAVSFLKYKAEQRRRQHLQPVERRGEGEGQRWGGKPHGSSGGLGRWERGEQVRVRVQVGVGAGVEVGVPGLCKTKSYISGLPFMCRN